jgi:membrane protease subunit HflK
MAAGNPWGSVPPTGGGPRRPNIPPNLPGWLQVLLNRLLARRRSPGAVGPGAGGRWLVIIPAAVLALWLASGIYMIQPSEQGVVLCFGAYQGTSSPGLNYHLPYPIEEVFVVPVTTVNRAEIGYTSSAQTDEDSGDVSLAFQDVPAESEMLTGDQNIVDINCAVFWQIGYALAYLFNTRNPDDTVKDVAESVLREVIGRNNLDDVLTTGRAQIEQGVQQQTQAVLDRYGTGIVVDEVQLQRVDPPPDVLDSFRDVQRAHTDAERMINQADAYSNNIVPTARGLAAQIVANAQGQKQATIANATGETQRFLSVLAAYRAAKDITLQRLYIETMQVVLSHATVTVVDPGVKGVLPMLNLDSQSAQAGAGATP